MLKQTYISPLSSQNAAREETGERMGFLFSLSPPPPPPPLFGYLPGFRIFPTLLLPASESRTSYHFGNVQGQQMLICILLYEGLKGKAVTDPSLC